MFGKSQGFWNTWKNHIIHFHQEKVSDTTSMTSTEQPVDPIGPTITISVTDDITIDGNGKQNNETCFPVQSPTPDGMFPITTENFMVPTITVSSSSSSSPSSSPKLKRSASCTSISSTGSTILDPTSPYQHNGKDKNHFMSCVENISESATPRPLDEVKNTPACKALLKKISSSLPLRMKRVGDFLEEWLGEFTYKPESHDISSVDDKFKVGTQSYFFTHIESAENEQSTNSPPRSPKLASPRKCNLVSKVTKVLSIKKRSTSGSSSPIMMTPKPQLTEPPISQCGKLLKLPLSSQSTRIIFLRDQTLETYQDNEHVTQKEVIQLSAVTSVQRLLPQVNAQGESIYCFEVNVQAQKTSPSCSKIDTTRLSYIFGSQVQSTVAQWMHWILESMTMMFPSQKTINYLRAGWCYINRSLTSEWQGAWILLTQHRSLLFTEDEVMEEIDLRKMRIICPTLAEVSIDNLHVDKGPKILIDCPPGIFYVVFPSVLETSTWTELIKKEAHNNGKLLEEQQLTKDDVPVVVDKCVNYIYANGSRIEGIYHKAGSLILTEKLLNKFRKDAFSVYGCPPGTDVNVVASCLKKFMRELPKPLIGDLAFELIQTSRMQKSTEKIIGYKKLLNKLSKIEYQTLRKITGHLSFIQSQKEYNRMSEQNLAIVWGTILLKGLQEDDEDYLGEETQVLEDFIILYNDLFEPTAAEIEKEQILVVTLEKFFDATEARSPPVALKIDHLKVWVKYAEMHTKSEESVIEISLNSEKTVYDVCQEVAEMKKLPVHHLTLCEVLFSGELVRLMHHREIVLYTALRWSEFSHLPDFKNCCFEIKPAATLLNKISETMESKPLILQNVPCKFADDRTKSLGSFVFTLLLNKIMILKKENQDYVMVKELELNDMNIYLGCEKKRGLEKSFCITFIEKHFKMRPEPNPFIGHILTGKSADEQMLWYSNMLPHLYQSELRLSR